jgi:peptidoglycan/LPS O-acetylase OafA/YrhL
MDVRNDNGTPEDVGNHNRQSMMRFGMMVAIALLLTSTSPAPLALAVFSSTTLVAAFVLGALALLFRENARAPHFTRWDEALAMLGLSMLAGMFVDPAAVQAHLAEYAPDHGAEPVVTGG